MQLTRSARLAVGTIVRLVVFGACDDDNGTGPGTQERPTYTIGDDEVWAGGELTLEWSDGELAPTAVYLDSLCVPLTVADSGRGYVPVPNDARGPMTVRVVTGEQEDTVGTVRVLGFWHGAADAPWAGALAAT